MINLTKIIAALIWLLAAIVTKEFVPFIKMKFDNEKYRKIMTLASIAVKAAEQIFSGCDMGKEKKEYVINFLKSKGFSIDEDELDVVIESAVLELKHAIDE